MKYTQVICKDRIDLFSFIRHSWSRGLKWVNKLNTGSDAILKREVFPKKKSKNGSLMLRF